MLDSNHDSNAVRAPVPEVAPRPRSGSRRWLLLLGALAVATGGLALWSAGPAGGPVDDRAAALALGPPELAGDGAAATVRRSVPPVDVAAVERGARVVTGGALPLPASREVASYRMAETGEEVLHAVLLYDDPAQADDLDRLAAPLLGSAFGLTEGELVLAGAVDPRSWAGGGYQVATFRVGGTVHVVATSSADAGRLRLLAEMARDKALAAGAATPGTAAAATAPPAGPAGG